MSIISSRVPTNMEQKKHLVLASAFNVIYFNKTTLRCWILVFFLSYVSTDKGIHFDLID